jgi:hypothetical protein
MVSNAVLSSQANLMASETSASFNGLIDKERLFGMTRSSKNIGNLEVKDAWMKKEAQNLAKNHFHKRCILACE